MYWSLIIFMILSFVIYHFLFNHKPNKVIKTGLGYDIHQLVENRDLYLGGVKIPHIKGLLGHSDADVLLHAISDAILGAIGENDIGHLFPPEDDSIKGISSLDILKEVVNKAQFNGFDIVNVDATLIAEEPKIKPYIPQMKKAINSILYIGEMNITIKATTNETLGSLGQKQGIAAFAVATVKG